MSCLKSLILFCYFKVWSERFLSYGSSLTHYKLKAYCFFFSFKARTHQQHNDSMVRHMFNNPTTIMCTMGGSSSVRPPGYTLRPRNNISAENLAFLLENMFTVSNLAFLLENRFIVSQIAEMIGVLVRTFWLNPVSISNMWKPANVKAHILGLCLLQLRIRESEKNMSKVYWGEL